MELCIERKKTSKTIKKQRSIQLFSKKTREELLEDLNGPLKGLSDEEVLRQIGWRNTPKNKSLLKYYKGKVEGSKEKEKKKSEAEQIYQEFKMSSTKRICILCGICKSTKHYNLARGIKKIANIIACENCRHFYLKLKDNPFPLDCISPIKGSCYSKCSFMQTRCKCCWAMQILDTCPHSRSFYYGLSNWISDDCKKQIRGLPVSLDDIDIDLRGKATIENNVNDEWIESPTSEMEVKEILSESNEGSNVEEAEKSKTDVHHTDSGNKKKSQKNEKKKADHLLSSMSDLALELDDDVDEVDVEEEESLVDDPASMDVDFSIDNSVSSRRSSTSVKGSERLKRRRKQVEYFTKQAASGRKAKGPIYGPDGKITKTRMDLCDCLQPECVGCHFPCPKCRSPKCGNECRVNRRWYYEKVEVEGTKMSWINRFVPKI